MVETLWDAITRRATDFIEGGQERRQWLDDLGRRAEYYVPPELRNILGFVAEATPTAAIDRAAQAGGEMLAPGRTPMQRLGSAGQMLSETAGVVAPAMVANRAAMPAAQAIQESLLGASAAADDIGRRFVERMNQPGPVPTMNAIFPSGASLDEVFGFVDKNKPIYHSGPVDMAEEMQKWGVEPSYGPWVREIAAGAVDDVDEFLDQTPPAAWWSDQPDWIKMKVARAAKKPVSDVTVDDIRKHGHLAIASADDYSDVAFRIGDEGLDNGEYSFVEDLAGNRMRFYETPLYSEGNYPFGIERNEIVTGEAIEPAYSLTGDDLVNFMQRRGLLDNPAGRGADDFSVTRKDASNIFGEGSERVRYTDAKSGGTMEVVVRPDGSASVLELEVPEASRGQGIGQALQQRVMQDFPVMGGQVSSKAAAKTAYRLGRRPYGQPDATLEDVFRMIDEDSSVNLISPQAQPNILPAPRNEAEAMAKQVLEMRAAGRAGDVTEEMMAATDPQYMFANTPLPMDYESRMRRAISQGFDVNDEMYRGDAPRQSFETGRGQRDKIGVTMSTRPDVAASYIPPRGEGGIYPLVSRGQSDAVIEAGGQNWNVIMPDTPVSFQGEQSLLSDYLPVEDYFEPYDVIGGTAFFDTNDLSRIYQGYGADRIRFNDLVDRGGSAKYYGPESSMPSDVQMVADPRNIRSRFARFDPAFSHLGNLSAGIGGLGILSLLAQQEQEVQ